MTARQRGQSWQADFSIQGRRYRRDFDTKQEAEAWEAETRLSIKAGKGVSTKAHTREMTLEDLRRRTYQNRWEGTKDAAGADMRANQIVKFFGQGFLASDVNGERVGDLIDHYKDKGLANSTINGKLSALRVMLDVALQRGAVAEVPRITNLPPGPGRHRFLSFDEQELVLQVCRQWPYGEEADLFEFLAVTGARLSEALKVNPMRDVNGDRVTFWGTKNGEHRTIPLVGRALEIVQERSDRPTLFSMSKRRAEYVWQKVRVHIGLEDDMEFVIHALRHTSCSRQVMAGVPLIHVQKWHGHKAIQTTMRYAHLAPDSLNDAAEIVAQVNQQKGRPKLRAVS